MAFLRRILSVASFGLALLLAQPVSAATNGAVLPLVKVPPAGIELSAAGFLPTNRLSGQVVRVLSTEGPFDMHLLTATAPSTVTNFLRYVDAGFYRNLLVHRAIPGRLIQSGAVTLNGTSLFDVPLFPPVTNEFLLSNLRGTVAMAKLAGAPDSATSDWFVNVSDNTELDTNNGGFAVFARVLGAGMSNVDRIAALPVYDKTNFFPTFGDLFAEMPLKNHNTNGGLFISNLVIISNVVKLPAATSSDQNAFTAELTSNNRVRVKFRGFPSNAVTVAVRSYDSSTNPWTVSFPVSAPSKSFTGLLDRTNRGFPALATLTVAPNGTFTGSLANRTGTAPISTKVLFQQFLLTNPNTGVLFRALGESVTYWYGHADASFFAINYVNTNASSGFTNTLRGAVMPRAYSGATNDACPLAGRVVNAVLTRTNESPRPVLGFLRFSFDKAGVARITGTLPDNRIATGTSAVVVEPWTGDKLLPFALFVRQGTNVALTGTLRVTETAGATSPVSGSLDWLSGTNASVVEVASAVWAPPAKGKNVLTGGTNAVTCTLQIAGLTNSNQTLLWGADSKTRFTQTNGTTIRPDASKGTFSGTALRTNNGLKVTVPFRGLLFSSVPPGMESGLRGAGVAVLSASNPPVPVKILLP
jgi:cyclophilin family peptidyl-prolyl cis-trans isomerase